MSDENPLTIHALRDYIRQELLNDEDISIEDDQDLLLTGMLDSLKVVRLASHIEQICGFNIPPEDMIIEHFGTLLQINTYIHSRK